MPESTACLQSVLTHAVLGYPGSSITPPETPLSVPHACALTLTTFNRQRLHRNVQHGKLDAVPRGDDRRCVDLPRSPERRHVTAAATGVPPLHSDAPVAAVEPEVRRPAPTLWRHEVEVRGSSPSRHRLQEQPPACLLSKLCCRVMHV